MMLISGLGSFTPDRSMVIKTEVVVPIMPAITLFPGDRLEPSPALLDITDFPTVQLPCTVVLWRSHQDATGRPCLMKSLAYLLLTRLHATACTPSTSAQ